GKRTTDHTDAPSTGLKLGHCVAPSRLFRNIFLPRWNQQTVPPSPGASGPDGALSKGRIATVNHETIGGVIGRGLAHQVHRDAAEVGRLAEAAHRNAGHDVGDELV